MNQITYSLITNDTIKVVFSGDFVKFSYDEGLRRDFFDKIKNESIKQINIKGEKIGVWDSSLAIIVFKIMEIAKKENKSVDLDDLPKGLKNLIELSLKVDRNPPSFDCNGCNIFDKIGIKTLEYIGSIKNVISFFKEVIGAFLRFLVGKACLRKIDLAFCLEDCSYKSLPIVALISFMVGMILAFVGAVQLKIFGAQIYVASLVMVSMVRVMGALMTGIIIAGKTGASYAATIGTMQVNEEIDALKTLGISEIDFLLIPRMISLMLMMPLLAVFSDLLGVLGGGFVGVFLLDLPLSEYIDASLKALFLNHFLIGILHGFVFGIVIAFCGCYHGIKCKKDAESVGKATTNAVVSSIVFIIVATSIITILCEAFKL